MVKAFVHWMACVLMIACLLLLLAPSVGLAQAGTTGSIRGVVTDSDGNPLGGVQITAAEEVSGETEGTLSQEDGRFVLPSVPTGRYRLEARSLGYAIFSDEVVVSASDSSSVAIVLVQEALALDPIMVVGTRTAQMRALEEKRFATNMREISVADEVGKLPDRGLADAVSRLAGVSVQQGVGDARYVSIRGISPELNQVSVNGQASAISDVDARAGRAP